MLLCPLQLLESGRSWIRTSPARRHRHCRRRHTRSTAAKWIALDTDGTSIIASADSLSVLEDELVAAGEDPEKVIFDRVEDDDSVLGGAELL